MSTKTSATGAANTGKAALLAMLAKLTTVEGLSSSIAYTEQDHLAIDAHWDKNPEHFAMSENNRNTISVNCELAPRTFGKLRSYFAKFYSDAGHPTSVGDIKLVSQAQEAGRKASRETKAASAASVFS